MIEKIKTSGMSREDWLTEREKSIGGSDAGAILGLNPYRSPYTVWAEKTGRLPEQEDNEAMRQGRDLEAYVAERFSEKSGKRVERYNYLLRNTDAPHLHANIDRRVIGEKSGLECKTSSALAAKVYRGGQFPESYYAQCVTYLSVTGWERWYLAVLVLNKAFFIFQMTTLPDDPCPVWCESSVFVPQAEIEELKSFAADFWERYVLADTPPGMDGFPSTSSSLKTMYEDENGESCELFGRDDILSEYFTLVSEEKNIQRRMDMIRQTIQGDMGPCSKASCGIANISWRNQERRTFDVKAFQNRHPDIPTEPFFKISKSRVFKITKTKDV